MADYTERDVLHHLIEVCKDGERGYRTAAEYVGATDLKMLFTQLAAERRQFAEELTPHLHRLGGAPDGGSSVAALHRGWMLVKTWIPGAPDHKVIVEAERGDQVALNAYEDALNGLLPPTVTPIIEAQREAIGRATERIRSYEMGYALS